MVNDTTDINEEIPNEDKKEDAVAALEEQIKQAEEKWKRALADYQNLARRTEEEKLTIVAFANKNLILQLLDVFDTLEATSKHLQDKGLELALKSFTDVLKGQDVEAIKTLDEDFNPEIMECVDITEGDEGKVLSELKKGYSMHGKVLRPALVVVGKAKEEQSKKEEKSAEAQ